MTDTSEAEVPPHTNGISDGIDEEDRAPRPVDIDADVREMERRKRVEVIMNSKMFREELERIIEMQLKEGSGTTGLMQQISDMMGVNKQAGNVFKNSNCVVPINDIRGIEAMGYAKGEKILRCKLAAVFRLIDLYGWTQGTNGLVTGRLNQDDELFLVSPYGMMFHEITASSLIKCDMQGNVAEQGTTNFSVNIAAFSLHAAVHAARPDIKCIINVHTPSVVAVSALKHGIIPLSQESVVIGDISTHTYLGGLLDPEEKDKLARNLGPINKVLLLSNQGALCCGETIEEAFFNARNTVLACESQLKLLPVGIDNLVLLNDEVRKKLYDAAHKAPESSPRPDQPSILEGKVERKWRVGGVEFEALMRMLDNAGFRTGYIYRHPLVKGDPPRPKNDVELPPAVSSLGYLLEEEELYNKGLWRKLEGGRKGHDRSRWLNSPNVYQKVEILETGTPDPKKITKWVADGSPTHSSTPVRIDAALQFVPTGTNPREFKQKQQQIKDYRRADKISAGPQSHILEGVTWEEARKMQDATVTQTGDQVVLMGAASKGIIQRGHQHNVMVYKSPYAKNPFDSVTDEELDEYKKVVEKKVKGEYDTDFSESEGLSSAQINKRVVIDHLRSPTSVTSETEEESRDEPRILRIETKHAPKPSQPEVVLSDVESSPTQDFLRAERVHSSNHKSVTVVTGRRKAYFTADQQRAMYRTNNYAGLPKGSYCIPNPTHFHIVRSTQVAIPMRPIIVKIGPQTRTSHYIFNRFNSNCNNANSTITINAGNLRSVSLGISMQTVRDFIQPFSNALNMLNGTVYNNNNQGTQTAYRKDETVDNAENCGRRQEDENAIERDILTQIKANLMKDLPQSDSDLDFESCSEDSNGPVESCNEMMEFSDEDFLATTHNESLANELPTDRIFNDDEISAPREQHDRAETLDDERMLNSKRTSMDCSEIVTNGYVAKEQLYAATAGSEGHKNLTLCSVEVQVDETEKLSINSESNEKQEPPANVVIANSYSRSVDEGIEDVTLSPTINGRNSPSAVTENVAKLAGVIFDYISEQHYNIQELLIFPEMINDPGAAKMLAILISLYRELYCSDGNLTAEEKSELRISICSHVLDLIEANDILNCSGDSSDSEIKSDKIFSVSEFLADIMDQLFEIIDERDEFFGKFSSSLNGWGDHTNHSTPITNHPEIQPTYEVVEEVTAFKQDKSRKSGTETYWISIGSPVEKRIDTPIVNRKIINVDDIPLRPPEDLDYFRNSPNRSLTPIIEEPRSRLFQSCDELEMDDYEQEYVRLGTEDDRYEQDPEHDAYDPYKSKQSFFESNQDCSEPEHNMSEPDDSRTETDDILSGGDSERIDKIISSIDGNYVVFDKPDTNVILSNKVSFFRTCTISSSSYTLADQVVITNKADKSTSCEDSFYSVGSSDANNNNKNDNKFCNDDVEGDWMGFDSAKF